MVLPIHKADWLVDTTWYQLTNQLWALTAPYWPERQSESAPGWRAPGKFSPWWRHQMETFSALLALCAGNSPVTGEFPAQRPVTRSFNVFFDLRLNIRLSKQSWGWWFETPLHSLLRHCNVADRLHVDQVLAGREMVWTTTVMAWQTKRFVMSRPWLVSSTWYTEVLSHKSTECDCLL